MNERTIRRPKGPAVIFLIQAISCFFTLFSSALMGVIFDYPEKLPLRSVLTFLIWGATNLFLSIALFSKNYNNLLLVGVGVLLVPSIFGLFFNITPYLISEIIFCLILFAFTYIMVKMPETPIREKTVKFRFVIPLFQFLLILISTIQTIQGAYEKFFETAGSYPVDTMNVAIALLPSILGAITGFLPVLCYVLLANWLANPYEK